MNRLNRQKTKNLFIISCLLLSLIIPGIFSAEVAYGDESSSEVEIGKKEVPEPQKQIDPDSEVGFSVEAIRGDTQVDESKSFFFVKVEPGQEQQLTLRVISTIDQERKVTIQVKDGFTNQSGEIDYDSANYQRDDTLKNSLEEITSVSEETVTVKNREVKDVILTVKPPEESFEGVKVAAICVMKAEDENDDEKKEGLSSNYGYRLGLMITEDAEVDYENSSSLNLLQVEPTVSHGKRVIQARLQNPEPKILNKLTVETKLRRKGEQEVLRKRTTNDMRMAPNSQFDFATNWGLDPIEPGTYTLSVKADSGENTWSWEEEFTIGEEEAKKINEQATYTITYPTWVPIVVVLLGVVTIINIGSLYVRRKKWTTPK